jgi:hypothetical protein
LINGCLKLNKDRYFQYCTDIFVNLHAKGNPPMNWKKSILLLFIPCCLLFVASCAKSRTHYCKVHRTYSKNALKKNKNNKGLIYSQKPVPVRKPYIIKNKRK